MAWEMHAHRYEDGRFHTIGSEPYVRAHGLKYPIVPVLVEEVPEDGPHRYTLGLDEVRLPALRSRHRAWHDLALARPVRDVLHLRQQG